MVDAIIGDLLLLLMVSFCSIYLSGGIIEYFAVKNHLSPRYVDMIFRELSPPLRIIYILPNFETFGKQEKYRLKYLSDMSYGRSISNLSFSSLFVIVGILGLFQILLLSQSFLNKLFAAFCLFIGGIMVIHSVRFSIKMKNILNSCRN